MPKDFHHFKGKGLSRSEKLQRKVTELILESKIPDEARENSKIWELKHSAGCCQIGRILAQKRDLDVELSEIICTLHDIYAIIEGKYKEHAKRGAQIAKKMLINSGDFKPEEIEIITEAIAQHSEKEVFTNKPFVELIKDVDAFDCSLYENSEAYYLLHKPKEVYEQYAKRIKNVRKELDLKANNVFR
ncbi:HD domain protein [uncultured archaeon]|nr:HD domain protein [uncultured archaeon]